MQEIRERLEQVLRERFGLAEFRRGQLGILQSVMGGKDTMAVMPTGGGKSLCYQIPAVLSEGLVVVISPLIALMKDQVQQLKGYGIAAGCIHSGQTLAEKRATFQRLKAGGAFVLYLSPERVQSPGFSAWVRQRDVELFAIDEAHCISQWGPDFREDYHKLKILRDLKPKTPILALTATATPTVLSDIQRQIHLNNPDRHVYGFYRPNLYYQVEHCESDAEKFGYVVQALNQFPQGRVLIYCGTRRQSEALALSLEERFERVGFYHAGLSPEERGRIQEQVDSGEIRILTATNAFGMGIDYPDVRLVIHLQIPANVESLYQEMGRAGRDGEPSTCLVLYAKKDRGLHSYFIQQSKAEPWVVRRRWNALEAITQYVESSECRHAGVLTYFRDADRMASGCGHCDVCDPQSSRWVAPPEVATKTFKSTKRKRKNRPIDQELTPALQLRCDAVREWRRAYAKQIDLPAFMVFGDRTLKDLILRHPLNLDQLAQVYGMGPAKIEKFGPELLKQLHLSAETTPSL